MPVVVPCGAHFASIATDRNSAVDEGDHSVVFPEERWSTMHLTGVERAAPEEELTDHCVAALRSGNPDARREVYDRFHQQVYRLAVRLVGLQDAEDVTQQVFLQIYRSINQFSSRSRFSTWLHRVAINEALQHLRRRKRWLRSQQLTYEPMDNSPGHEDTFSQRELLEKSLQRLNPQLRTIFLLREMEGLSYQEIAGALEVPMGTVGSRLNQARRELRAILTELGGKS